MTEEERIDLAASYLRENRETAHMFEMRSQLLDRGWPPSCIEAAEVRVFGRPTGMRRTLPRFHDAPVKRLVFALLVIFLGPVAIILALELLVLGVALFLDSGGIL